MTDTAVVVFTDEKKRLIQQTVAQDANPAELLLFLEQCQRTGLDPVMRQIHFVKRGDKGVYQVAIDGYRLIADRTGRYCGNDNPVYDTEDAEHPDKATVTVWKLVGGQRCAFTASARWKEYRPLPGRQDFMWVKMPYLMLAKCAESLALRKAFPQELSGLYTHEEMQQAGEPMIVTEAPANGHEPPAATETDVARELAAAAGFPVDAPEALTEEEAVAPAVRFQGNTQERAQEFKDYCMRDCSLTIVEIQTLLGCDVRTYMQETQHPLEQIYGDLWGYVHAGRPMLTKQAFGYGWREPPEAAPSDEEAAAPTDGE